MKIKNVTKKELREFLRIERGYGPMVYQSGAFIYNNKVNLYLDIKGQGVNPIVYNKQYVDIVSLDHYCDKRDYTLVEAVNSAHEMIVDMIDYYEEKKKEEVM